MNEKDGNEKMSYERLDLRRSAPSSRPRGASRGLTGGDKDHIAAVFAEEVEPKLRRLHGRRGVLNCDFAGQRYRHWNIRFESAGSGFTIVDFEFDEEGCGLDLDL